jgi:hypothetical protein
MIQRPPVFRDQLFIDGQAAHISTRRDKNTAYLLVEE